MQKPFERAVALLHSFWYLESAKAFAAIAQADPSCGMAYWGVALSQWTQIWSPPPPPPSSAGWRPWTRRRRPGPRRIASVTTSRLPTSSSRTPTSSTTARGPPPTPRPWSRLYQRYPQDREAAIFYALALQATADPHDKTLRNQRRSGEIAEKVFAVEPNHPGAAHYIIHAYDYPAIAQEGLPAARRYAQFAPSAPHALHMPSHIYVLLGMWPETVKSNLVAAEAEKDRGNPDDRMHALDYLVYAYLQQAQDADAKRVVDEARGIMADLAAKNYNSGRATAAFAMAAIEARWTMERGRWAEAAVVEVRPNNFPHTEAVIYFAWGIGAARTGDVAQARAAADKLAALRDALTQRKDTYWAEQVEIERRAVAAWLARAEGKNDDALALMRSAAELEASTEKHNISPGPIALARELHGDMLLDARQPAKALVEYETALKISPNRFKALQGAAKSAELAGDRDKAKTYYARLLTVAATSDGQRPELGEARAFVSRQ